jgi:hypothetical protein
MRLWTWLKEKWTGQRLHQNIFHFLDGAGKRSADPAVVESILADKLGDEWRDEFFSFFRPDPFGVIGEEADRHREQKNEKRRKILDTICEAFRVDEFDDQDPHSMTREALDGLLMGFIMYCDDLIANARPFGKPQSRASPGADSPPTSSGADASSTEDTLKMTG